MLSALRKSSASISDELGHCVHRDLKKMDPHAVVHGIPRHFSNQRNTQELHFRFCPIPLTRYKFELLQDVCELPGVETRVEDKGRRFDELCHVRRGLITQ